MFCGLIGQQRPAEVGVDDHPGGIDAMDQVKGHGRTDMRFKPLDKGLVGNGDSGRSLSIL